MLAGKKQNIDPMWKVLNKQVHFKKSASFLDHVYLGCTQRQSETSQKMLLTIIEPCSNPEFQQEQLKNYQELKKTAYFFVVLRYEMSCQEMYGMLL